jgi:succinate-semialdehyde dehydrogenase / glutarate-semialdehyde dehydrogenase
MMLTPEGPSALPLWLNGRAFLTATPAFHTICNPQNGQALRLTPLCGAHELALAVDSASVAFPAWSEQTTEARTLILHTTAQLLEKFCSHISKILQEEAGLEERSALQEVTDAIQSLRAISSPVPLDSSTTLITVIADASESFSKPIKLIGQALAAGQCVILKPSVKTPSALYAFAEITARAALPAGVFSLVHGDDEMMTAIAESTSLKDIIFTGTNQLFEKIQVQMNQHLKHFVLA